MKDFLGNPDSEPLGWKARQHRRYVGAGQPNMTDNPELFPKPRAMPKPGPNAPRTSFEPNTLSYPTKGA